MTRYVSASGLVHRLGNLHPGMSACGHHRVADLIEVEADSTRLRCWGCFRIGGAR